MDWIGTLPEEVVCHILSFLPTKQAAVTSALSKRWHSLWTLVPNLDIDDSVFLHPEEGKGERDGIRQSFVDFVDRILAMQDDSPIEKFSLKCITCVHPDTVNRWICNVLQRGVSYLDLFIDFSFEDIEDEGYYLPQEMFVSKTLVELKIRSERSVNWWTGGEGTFLPMLKTLDIDSELIICGEMESFLPSLPALEELRMANMEWPESNETMSSASLRKLSIHGTGSEEFENPMSISFDTPNLLYLNYSDLVAEDYPIVNMGKLFEARINLIVKNEDQIKRVREPNNDLLEDNEGDVVLQFGNVVKLMIGIQNVQELYLTSDTLELLSICCESMPVFNNLKVLGIKSDECRGWQAVPALLKNCPKIEFLFIEGLLHFVTDNCGDACDCISREDKGRSLISCPVKKLQVKGFRGTIREKEMIRHFLEFCPCLDEMEIDAEDEENDSTNFQVPKILKIVAYKLHDVVSTEIVSHWQSSVRSGFWSQTQMDEIYFELAPRNKERIYDMVFIMHGASSPVPPPLSQEDYLQMQLDAAKAELSDLKERQRDQDAQIVGYEAQFDMIVDQNPMLASALRAREATESERAKASGQQMTQKKRNYDVLFDIIAEQNPMLASALRARRATDSERAETSRD